MDDYSNGDVTFYVLITSAVLFQFIAIIIAPLLSVPYRVIPLVMLIIGWILFIAAFVIYYVNYFLHKG